MLNGWIKLHRQFLDWGWYGDPITKAVFIHLLIKANRKNTVWRGVKIERGQLVTSRSKLVEELTISEQSIRTSLNRLKSTNEITIKTTNRYSLITLVNYDTYQGEYSQPNQQTNQPSNHQLTSNQPATNQQLTTNKKDKNRENIYIKEKEKFLKEKEKQISKGNKKMFEIFGDRFESLDNQLQELLKDFVDMRKKIRSPMTSQRQGTLLLNKLESLSDGDTEIQIALLEEALLNNWKSVYETNNSNVSKKKEMKKMKEREVESSKSKKDLNQEKERLRKEIEERIRKAEKQRKEK